MGLRPLAYWDCGFKSRLGHGCLSLMSVVCCQVEVSAGLSSRGVLPNVVCLKSMWSWSLEKWGALGPQGAVEPLETNKKTICITAASNEYYWDENWQRNAEVLRRKPVSVLTLSKTVPAWPALEAIPGLYTVWGTAWPLVAILNGNKNLRKSHRTSLWGCVYL
jgi:hypothetical protein